MDRDSYIIVEVESVYLDQGDHRRLVQEVNKRMKEGYIPLGSISYGQNHYLKKDRMAQAMVLKE